MIFVLLLCGDIETCPGPSNCCNCQKNIRRNQGNISCNECERNSRPKYFDESDGVDVCSECYESNMAASGKNTQLGESMSDNPPVLEELLNLVSSKGIELLRQNICGLVIKYWHIEFILKSYQDIHMFTLSETHFFMKKIFNRCRVFPGILRFIEIGQTESVVVLLLLEQTEFNG